MPDLCPRCDEQLPHANSASCKCGWRKRGQSKQTAKPREPKPCAHMDCVREAVAKIQTKTGWASVCYEHYLEHHTREAVAYNRAHGIVTTADCIRNCRQLAGLTKRLMTLPAEREPGEDREEEMA